MKATISINNMTRAFMKTAALLIALVVLLMSCDVTDLQPNNNLPEGDAFSSPERVALSVSGVYSAAQMGTYTDGTVSRGYPFGAATTEQGDARGEDIMAIPSFYLITYEGTYNATTANNQAHWETLYQLVNRGNVVLEGVKGAVEAKIITPELGLEYEAEIRFLRALAHHELLVYFARPYAHTADASHLGVPYKTVAINSPEAVDANKGQARNTVKECYDLILTDLDFAEANSPATRSANKVSRVTKGAAIAIKARVYQHMGNWAKVIDESNKIVALTGGNFTSPIGGYGLTTFSSDPFLLASQLSNKESIFSVENSSTRNPGTNGSIGQMYSKAPGRALMAISPIIWNAPFWLPNDLRRTELATNDGRAYFTTKHKDYSTFTDSNPIIRYSEVVLNLAEALARTSPLDTKALALLNAVRNRAVTTPADQFEIGDFATGDDLVKAILNERRIEFLAEGRRWPDIHRLAKDPVFWAGNAGDLQGGIPAKVSYTGTTFASWNALVPFAGTKSVKSIAYDDNRFVWPIPQTETNTNKVLAEQQNPGY